MKKSIIIFIFFICAQVIAQDLPSPSYNSIGLKVHLDTTFNDPQFIAEVSDFLDKKHIGWVSKDKSKSDILLSYDGEYYTITQLPEERIVYKIDNSKPSKTLKVLKDKVYQYAYGYQIKNLNLKNESFKFSFRLLPAKYNNKDEIEVISPDSYPKTNGILNFNTNDSAAMLEVTNLSDNPIYFSVIEINSRGELSGFIPNINCALIGQDRKISPNETFFFDICYFQFSPPFETLTLKGFASPEPINFNPIIGNQTLKTRGPDNTKSLEYIKDFYTEMYTYEYEYNIVNEYGNMTYEAPVDIYKPNTSPELENALLELKKLNPDKGSGLLSDIKGNKKTKKYRKYISKLKDVAELHQALGNLDEASEYYITYEKLKVKQEFEKKSSQKKKTDKERKEAARRVMLYESMSDAEKIAFLEKENDKKIEEISNLKKQVSDLIAQVKTLSNNDDSNSQMRGAKPKKKEVNIISKFTYRALIIAEENYSDKNISDLKFPIDDATELKNVLINNYAFDESNITFLINPTRKQIFEALHQQYDINSDTDHLLIFYAGHGVYDEDFKRGYWLPSDAELNNKSSWMSNLDIKDYIANIKTKHTLLISDACFSGSIFEFNRDVNTETSAKAVEKLLKKNARNAMTSGLDKPVPDESVFIKYLLKTLKENQSTHLKASDLFKTIQEVVLNNTDNIPQYGVIRNANHEGGEFIFLKRE